MKPQNIPTLLTTTIITHCQALKLSLLTNTHTSNNLINKYSKLKNPKSALQLFDEMPHPDSASYNTVISCYVNSNAFSNAWAVLKSMKNHGFLFDAYTFGSVLKGVGTCRHGLIYGRQVHADVVKMGLDENVYACSALLDMYCKCGRVEDADRVFTCMQERNTVSWNGLIAGYAERDDLLRCMELFLCMERDGVSVDDATFAPILSLVCGVEFYDLTRQLHGKILKRGLGFENTVINAVISAYAECGGIEDGKRVFDSCDGYRDLVTWNSILAGYLENDMGRCGFGVFLRMMRLGLDMDAYSYSSIISGSFGEGQRNVGKSLHCLVIKKGVEELTQVSNALISMYLKFHSRDVEGALKVFEGVNVKDHVSWNTILTGLSQNGLSENALSVFSQMHFNYLVIDQYAFSAVLRACSDLATLRLGQQIHVLVVKSGLERNEYVASALIFMYSKCGILEDAWRSFDESRKESSVTWNSIMFAYAQHGQGKFALELFHLMRETRVKLDHITFVAALTACSHIGLVEEGLQFLKSMEKVYGVLPRMENYACAIDLLGRGGRLMEAKELIDEMPFEPDVMVWKTFLGACRACGDIELASHVASHLLELDPADHCTYVLLSDMYGHFKRWDEKASVKRLMRENGVKKVPGWSWIELRNDVHAFNAYDHSHPNCREIYQTLNELISEIKFSEDDPIFDVLLDDLNLVDAC